MAVAADMRDLMLEATELVTDPDASATSGYARTVSALLHLVRRQVAMDVAWISEFTADHQIYRFVDAEHGALSPNVGDRVPLSGTYCARVLEGTLPSLIPDMRTEPGAAMLEATRDLNVGAYVGVSLHDATGTVTGRLCAISTGYMPTLNERDLGSMRLVADLVEDLTLRMLDVDVRQRHLDEVRRRVDGFIAGSGRQPVVQPILDLDERTVVAVEALTRFTDDQYNVAQWFDVAARLGLRDALELAVAATQLELLRAPTAPPAVAINVSPQTILNGGLDALLASHDRRRVIVEITENAPVADYAELQAALARHREQGLRVAIDDVGAGYANFAHILAMEPDLVKIDLSLVRGIAHDTVRQALVSAMVAFVSSVGATLVAEGLETDGDLATVARLGVPFGQGFALGVPEPWPQEPH